MSNSLRDSVVLFHINKLLCPTCIHVSFLSNERRVPAACSLASLLMQRGRLATLMSSTSGLVAWMGLYDPEDSDDLRSLSEEAFAVISIAL